LQPTPDGSRLQSVSELEAIGGDVEDAVARVRVPAYVIDPRGIIRWLNPGARKLVGDVRCQHFTSVVASDVGSGAIIRTLRPARSSQTLE
jgi:hypothetical protein